MEPTTKLFLVDAACSMARQANPRIVADCCVGLLLRPWSVVASTTYVHLKLRLICGGMTNPYSPETNYLRTPSKKRRQPVKIMRDISAPISLQLPRLATTLALLWQAPGILQPAERMWHRPAQKLLPALPNPLRHLHGWHVQLTVAWQRLCFCEEIPATYTQLAANMQPKCDQYKCSVASAQCCTLMGNMDESTFLQCNTQ